MDPVEINAGAWYLRALRADDRVDDRSALADLGETDTGYVARTAAGWASDTGSPPQAGGTPTWAVCEPTTGELLAEVTLDPVSGEIATRARDGHADAALTAAESVRRFAAGALALDPVTAGSGGTAPSGEDPADSADPGD
ncbi:MAG: hypothetical protein ACRDTN_11285 [Mycobacterium sp.]